MKTEAAERMRSKLEKKLVPKLKAEIPKWAERLRFLHAQVLKWHEPAPLLRPESPPPPPPKPIVHEMKGADRERGGGRREGGRVGRKGTHARVSSVAALCAYSVCLSVLELMPLLRMLPCGYDVYVH